MKPKPYEPSLVVDPSPGRYTPYVVSGSGYSSEPVTVVAYSPTAAAFAGQVPVDGAISLSNFATSGPGAYKLHAWQHLGHKDTIVATLDFVVG